MLESFWCLRLVAFIVLVTIPVSSWAYDSGITLTSPSGVVLRRAVIIKSAFGNSGRLPKTQSVVTTNVANPFPTFTNIARVDEYHDPITPGSYYPEDALLLCRRSSQ